MYRNNKRLTNYKNDNNKSNDFKFKKNKVLFKVEKNKENPKIISLSKNPKNNNNINRPILLNFMNKKNLIYRNKKNNESIEDNHKRHCLSQISNIKINKSNKNSNKSLNNRVNKNFNNNLNLKNKVSQLVKEISNNHKIEKKSPKIENDFSNKNIEKNNSKIKTLNLMAKISRNKLFNLLNKDGELNTFLKTMKFNKTNKDNLFESKEYEILRRPKNTIEMNKLLINSFSLNKIGSNELGKKLYSLNESFFATMNEMRKRKAEMDLEKLDKNINIHFDDIRNREKNLEIQFLSDMYINKISEKYFKYFKKMKKIHQKKEIIDHSKLLANNIMKMDAKEYEKPDELYEFRSTRSFISNINIYRIRRIKRIMKNIKDKEQIGGYDYNVEKLKKNQKKSEAETMLAIKRLGKPRFLKTQFKANTVSKFKGISGNYFGLPA